MRKKIISLFVILIVSLNLVSQSAYANSDGEILTPISSEETLTPSAVINPGSAAVGVTLKTNQFVAVSDSIKIIDGTGNVVNTGLKFPKNAGLKFLTSLILILKAEGTPQPSFSPPCDMNRL
ncbi:hypothetical protein [Sporosarcina sp. FSL K6-5500]|uniref:hypothetical protein n=1 Tax=Sporosarcina sp. FSL K6-5500 TaxID=2921558 RepID=UPI0030F6EFBD